MTAKNTQSRHPGQWRPGQSGNPKGRTPGVPNRITRELRERIAGSDPIGQLIRFAGGKPLDKDGDKPTTDQRLRALVVLVNKLLPDARTAELPVPADIGALANPEDVRDAIARIAALMGSGDLSPAEASALIGPLDSWRQAHELTELERRLAELEAKVNEGHG